MIGLGSAGETWREGGMVGGTKNNRDVRGNDDRRYVRSDDVMWWKDRWRIKWRGVREQHSRVDLE
jgi:hypothetical protein